MQLPDQIQATYNALTIFHDCGTQFSSDGIGLFEHFFEEHNKAYLYKDLAVPVKGNWNV